MGICGWDVVLIPEAACSTNRELCMEDLGKSATKWCTAVSECCSTYMASQWTAMVFVKTQPTSNVNKCETEAVKRKCVCHDVITLPAIPTMQWKSDVNLVELFQKRAIPAVCSWSRISAIPSHRLNSSVLRCWSIIDGCMLGFEWRLSYSILSQNRCGAFIGILR